MEQPSKIIDEAILNGLYVNAATLARLLYLGKRRVYQLVDGGVLKHTLTRLAENATSITKEPEPCETSKE